MTGTPKPARNSNEALDIMMGTRPGERVNSLIITRQMKHDCIGRELRMRRRVYPAWVMNGRMSQIEADRQIAIMEAIQLDYVEADLFGQREAG